VPAFQRGAGEDEIRRGSEGTRYGRRRRSAGGWRRHFCRRTLARWASSLGCGAKVQARLTRRLPIRCRPRPWPAKVKVELGRNLPRTTVSQQVAAFLVLEGDLLVRQTRDVSVDMPRPPCHAWDLAKGTSTREGDSPLLLDLWFGSASRASVRGGWFDRHRMLWVRYRQSKLSSALLGGALDVRPRREDSHESDHEQLEPGQAEHGRSVAALYRAPLSER
jgi:hypothetical protein